jgi:hypothetical protein
MLINKDIEIIISTRSIGNINSLYDSDNILGVLPPNIYCNYFQNSTKNEVNFYFRDKNALQNNLNFPQEFQNTFINCLNNHIFLYLQLELYYFISLISEKFPESKDDKNMNDKYLQTKNNSNEEEEFLLNISRICEFFFICLDSFYSVSCLNSTQENVFQKEIDNFKYTLVDLISIYSKYGYKIKTFFLKLFAQKIKEKKYFDYCVFIATFDFYDIKSNDVFENLFDCLNSLNLDEYDRNQIKQLASKLLEFDKIYLEENFDKSTKKEYSKFMRMLIKKAINEEIEECFAIYRDKLKSLKNEFEKNNSINLSEKNNIDKKDKKACDDNSDIEIVESKSEFRKESSNQKENDDCINISNNINNENKKENNLDILILIYKYLKNLYIGINGIKKK